MRGNGPDNLAPQARRDLVAIITRSAIVYGAARADRAEERILRECPKIAEGIDHGHTRDDVPTRRVIHFIVVRPWVIAYNPTTRRVLRILDGRRDLGRIIG